MAGFLFYGATRGSQVDSPTGFWQSVAIVRFCYFILYESNNILDDCDNSCYEYFGPNYIL